MLKAKIHNARVTALKLEYEGSITIDRELISLVDILPGEKVHVLNLNTGARIETYVIPGDKGEICLNGPAARTGQVGDKLIILSYVLVSDDIARKEWHPHMLYLDENNRPVKVVKK